MVIGRRASAARSSGRFMGQPSRERSASVKGPCYRGPMLHGRIATLRHESRVLKDNPLGDPHVREVLVYLPPDYEQGGPYPTITLLPGFAANHRSMLGYKPF